MKTNPKKKKRVLTKSNQIPFTKINTNTLNTSQILFFFFFNKCDLKDA